MLYHVTDTAALRHNAQYIRKTANAPLIAVLKHDAYGAGLVPCAGALADCTDAFAVETVQEALCLHALGLKKDIHVLAPLSPQDLPPVPREIILPVDSLDIISSLANIYMGKPVCVQLRADIDNSGIGLREADISEALRCICADRRLRLRGLFAHCPALYGGRHRADIAARFGALAALVRAAAPDALCHLAASSAWQDKSLRFDALRVGTNLWGLSSFDGQALGGLQPVVSLHTHLVRVFNACSLQFYDGRFDALRPRRVGFAAAGYGQLPALIRARDLRVLVRGVSVPVLGSCAMGHMMLDLSALPEACPADEVVLVGRSGQERRTAHQFAAACGIPLSRCEGALFTRNALHTTEKGART